MQFIISYISNLDTSVTYAFQSIGPAWKPVAFFLSYGLGYEAMLVIFLITLFLLRKHRIAFELLIIALISLIVVVILKIIFHAPRPYLIDPKVITYDTDIGFGMPSAHAVMSIVILGWITLRHPKSRIILWGSIIMLVLIGWSRIYLGVHYASQVIVGWIVGFILVWIFYFIHKRFKFF